MRYFSIFSNKNRLVQVAFALLAGLVVLITTSQQTSGSTELSCQCGTLITVDFGPTVPGDNKLVTGQVQADCFAWAEFVALNWPSSGTGFGTPGDMSPVQWETYMPREVLMTPDGSPPPAWGNLDNVKAPANMLALLKGQPAGTKLLYHTSKSGTDNDDIDLTETREAFPSGKPSWLGAQNGTNIWYEVLVNKDEYDFIVQKGYYNAKTQYDSVVVNGSVISLPKGNDQQTGAVELKASWMEVKEPENSRWKRYKLSRAVVKDPGSDQPRVTTVALIGLHILHRTASQPTWFWATFEHVDNAPDINNMNTPYAQGYNLFNASCSGQTVSVPDGCDNQPQTYNIGCEPNVSPPYYLCATAKPVPIQVVREIPIDPEARKVNAQMMEYINKNFPGSVWANYQLVNMIWSTTPQTTQNNRTPQGVKSLLPVIPVANSVAETYIQQTSCINCHQYASIAPYPPSGIDTDTFASDFSFILEFANYSKTSAPAEKRK